MNRTFFYFIITLSFIVFFGSFSIYARADEEAVVDSLFGRVDINVSACGDCTLGTDVNFSRGSSLPAKFDEVGDPAYFFGGVNSVFGSDDLTIINMEGTLTDRGARADKTYAFKGDPSYTSILSSGSIEAGNLANNHSRDYGEVSLEDTINYMDQAGVIPFGNDMIRFFEKQGIKVALIGVYELPQGINCKPAVIDRVNLAKSEGSDLIIVSFHWGTERDYYPDNIQKELAHTAIDCGADLVIGHHPHVLQGIELYKGKYINYSLGNFCFGGNKNPSDKDTMIFNQTFSFDDGNLVLDKYPQGVLRDMVPDPNEGAGSLIDAIGYHNVNIYPCRISSVTYVNDYRPTILEGDEGQRVFNRIREFSIPFFF